MLNLLDDLSDALDFPGVGALFALIPVVTLTVLGALGYLN